MNGSEDRFRDARLSKRLFWMALVVCIFSASGCAKSPPATPVLELAGSYTMGQNDIPAGKYLVVEAWTNSDGKSSTGTCPYAAMIDMPMYDIGSGKLESFMEPQRDYSAANPGPPDLLNVVGYFGYGFSNSGDMGGGASSDLTVIESLPANPKSSIFTILSAAADGTIVIRIGSAVYRMKPGERWVQYAESQPDKHCRLLDTDTFTNYGLLDGDQIYIYGTPVVPAITPTP